MDFKETLEEYKKKIEAELSLFFKAQKERAGKVSPSALEIIESVEEFTMRRGKRIRPILAVIGYNAVGGRDEKEIIKAAIAVELMESFLLVHDDIIDQDELRRGKSTLHKVFEGKAERKISIGSNDDTKRYGESMAIIGGDILAVLGSTALMMTKFPLERKLMAIEKFNSVVINTCFGQILDVGSQIDGGGVDESDVFEMHKLKTAAYTIEGPLQIGAILGGASEEGLEEFSGFAIPLGQAFQIQDDILGMFGDESRLGKAVGSDIKEGKMTLLVLKALEWCSGDESRFLLRSLGNKDISKQDIERVRDVVRKTGALEYSEGKAADLVNNAKESINSLNIGKDAKDFLIGMADYILARMD